MTDETQGTAITERPVRLPALTAGGTVAAIIPTTFDEAYRLGNAFFKAGMAPKGLNSAEACTGVIIAGAELGLPPYMSLQSFANINGRTAIWGDAIPALLWSHGFKLKEWTENSDPAYPDNMVAKCIVTRPDGTEIEGEFSVGDAKEAKLWSKDGPWQTAKKRMMKMRARGFAARDGASDVLRGMHLVEEVQDYDEVTEVPRGRQKKNLAERLTQPAATQAIEGPKDENPPHDAETGEIIEAEVEDIAKVEETDPQSSTDARTAEPESDTKASATDASTASAEETSEVEEDGGSLVDPLMWWEVEEASPGVPAVDEVYRMAGDVPDGKDKVPTYKNGVGFSSVGEKGAAAIDVYEVHAPEIAPQQADAAPQEPQDAPSGFIGTLRPMEAWSPGIKEAWIAMIKTPFWKESDEAEQDETKRAVWSEVIRAEPDKARFLRAEDPTAFVIWMATQSGNPGADLIEEVAAELYACDRFANANAATQEAVKARATAKIAKMRG